MAARHLGHNSGARVDANAQLRANAVGRNHVACNARDTIVNGQRGTAGSERRILERDGNAEQSHDAVAGEIANRAALLFDDSRHHAGHAPHEGKSRLFAGPFGKGREADQVGKEYRYLPTFAFRLRSFKLGRHFSLPMRSVKSAT